MGRASLLALAVVTFLVLACTPAAGPVGPVRTDPGVSAPSTLVPASAPSITLTPIVGPSAPTNLDPIAAYGYGPQPDAAITYQPDVVLIGGGPAAIRGVTADGLTWSIDASASGADQLVPGKIMFASSDGLGRVVRVEPKPGVMDVTIAPVGVGEVISDGRLVIDQAVPLEALSIYEAPVVEDYYEDAPSQDLTASPSPAAHLDRQNSAVEPVVVSAAVSRPQAARGEGREFGAPNQLSTKVSGWNLSAYRTSTTLGLRAERGVGASGVQGADLKVALDAHIEVADLRVVSDIPITRGEVGSGHFRVFGIKGLVLSIEAGAVNGLSDNRKARVEIPVQLTQRLIIGGFPATLSQKFKFLVETAFTAKNGTITASAAWDVDGSIGVDGNTVTLPTMTAREPKLIDTISGVSIGVNGMVVAVSFQFGLTFGLPIAGAGPAASLITSLGLTNGSSLGIVHCKQASITSVVSAGVGIQVFDPIKTGIKKLLGYDIPAQTTISSKNILDERWVKPDVVACR